MKQIKLSKSNNIFSSKIVLLLIILLFTSFFLTLLNFNNNSISADVAPDPQKPLCFYKPPNVSSETNEFSPITCKTGLPLYDSGGYFEAGECYILTNAGPGFPEGTFEPTSSSGATCSLVTVLVSSPGSGSNTNPKDVKQPSIKKCENENIDNTKQCKKEFQKCNSSGFVKSGEEQASCKKEVIDSYTTPSINRCNDTNNTTKCVERYEKCDKNGSNAKEIVRCKKDVIEKEKAEDTKYEGTHLCGNIRDDNGQLTDDNYKTKFDFGCLGRKGPDGLNPIEDLLFAFLRFISVGVGIVVVIAIIASGIQYSTSEGNAEATQKAKSRIRSTIIGLIVYVLAFSLFQFLVPGGLFKPGVWVDFITIVERLL